MKQSCLSSAPWPWPAAALLLLLCLGSGCGPFYGIFIHPLTPTPTVAAEHHFGGKRLLIWVDDYSSQQPNPILRRELTNQLQQELLRHQAAGNIINYHDTIQFRYRHPDFARWTIPQLGQKNQADEVLYLLIEKFDLFQDTNKGFIQASMSGYAKVVDVAGGNRLWPADRNNTSFSAEDQLTAESGLALEDDLIRQLAQKLARQLALFFYEHPKTGP